LLKGKKRNRQGKGKAKGLPCAQNAKQKIRIFEECQNTQVAENSKDEKIKTSLISLGFLNGKPKAVIQCDRTRQQGNVFPCMKAIKEKGTKDSPPDG